MKAALLISILLFSINIYARPDWDDSGLLVLSKSFKGKKKSDQKIEVLYELTGKSYSQNGPVTHFEVFQPLLEALRNRRIEAAVKYNIVYTLVHARKTRVVEEKLKEALNAVRVDSPAIRFVNMVVRGMDAKAEAESETVSTPEYEKRMIRELSVTHELFKQVFATEEASALRPLPGASASLVWRRGHQRDQLDERLLDSLVSSTPDMVERFSVIFRIASQRGRRRASILNTYEEIYGTLTEQMAKASGLSTKAYDNYHVAFFKLAYIYTYMVHKRLEISDQLSKGNIWKIMDSQDSQRAHALKTSALIAKILTTRGADLDDYSLLFRDLAYGTSRQRDVIIDEYLQYLDRPDEFLLGELLKSYDHQNRYSPYLAKKIFEIMPKLDPKTIGEETASELLNLLQHVSRLKEERVLEHASRSVIRVQELRRRAIVSFIRKSGWSGDENISRRLRGIIAEHNLFLENLRQEQPCSPYEVSSAASELKGAFEN